MHVSFVNSAVHPVSHSLPIDNRFCWMCVNPLSIWSFCGNDFNILSLHIPDNGMSVLLGILTLIGSIYSCTGMVAIYSSLVI